MAGDQKKPAAQKPVAVAGLSDDDIVKALQPRSQWKEADAGGLLAIAKMAMTLTMGYENTNGKDWENAVVACRRNIKTYQGKIALLETLAKARNQVQKTAIDARIAKMDQEIAEFETQTEAKKGELEPAREQRLRNRAYEICAAKVIEAPDRPSLQNKIETVQSSTELKRKSTSKIDEVVEKRVRKMTELAASFDKLKEEMTQEEVGLPL